MENNIENINKQNQLLKILFEEFKKVISQKECMDKEPLKIRFKSRISGNCNNVFKAINEFLKSNSFDFFEKNYHIYLEKTDYSYAESDDAYYDIVWDFKTFFEQQSHDNKVNIDYHSYPELNRERDPINFVSSNQNQHEFEYSNINELIEYLRLLIKKKNLQYVRNMVFDPKHCPQGGSHSFGEWELVESPAFFKPLPGSIVDYWGKPVYHIDISTNYECRVCKKCGTGQIIPTEKIPLDSSSPIKRRK